MVDLNSEALSNMTKKIEHEMVALAAGALDKFWSNNVHMELYRDLFKTLVFNERIQTGKIKTLVFIAPKVGIQKLGAAFPKNVQAISARLGLSLKLRELP